MTDAWNHVKEIIFKRKLPALEEVDDHSGKPLIVASNKTVKAESSQKVDLDVVHRKLQRELEDKRRNASAIRELFIYQPEETVWGRFKESDNNVRRLQLASRKCAAWVEDWKFDVFLLVGIKDVQKDSMASILCYNLDLRLWDLLVLEMKRNFTMLLWDTSPFSAMGGFLYRFQRGMRSALSTAIIGAVLGSSIPLIVWPFLYFDGRTLDGLYKEMRQEDFSDKLKDQKLSTEILEAMETYNIGYFAARKRVQEWREGERIRMATAYSLNREAALTGRRDISKE
uniref:Uncharacterized protein n=1 Tax=Romanomermis culicivorax TaxID=13658 RepID=A0A915HQX6_ROMCU